MPSPFTVGIIISVLSLKMDLGIAYNYNSIIGIELFYNITTKV